MDGVFYDENMETSIVLLCYDGFRMVRGDGGGPGASQ